MTKPIPPRLARFLVGGVSVAFFHLRFAEQGLLRLGEELALFGHVAIEGLVLLSQLLHQSCAVGEVGGDLALVAFQLLVSLFQLLFQAPGIPAADSEAADQHADDQGGYRQQDPV